MPGPPNLASHSRRNLSHAYAARPWSPYAQLFDRVREVGAEGIVSKRLGSLYRGSVTDMVRVIEDWETARFGQTRETGSSDSERNPVSDPGDRAPGRGVGAAILSSVGELSP